MTTVDVHRDDALTLADLNTDIDRLIQVAESFSGDSASAMLREVPSLVAKLDSLRLLLVSRINQSGIWRDDPNGTLESFLRRLHGRDHRESKRDTRAAEFLNRYPSAREAASGGRLSREHVDVMVAVGMRNPTRERILDEFLSPFLEIAASQPASVLKTVMRRWADQVDPLTEIGDERDAHRRRYLNVNQVGDGVYLEGFFDNTDGAKVMAAVNAAMTRHFRATRSQSSSSSRAHAIGEASIGVGMPSQARADAFICSIIDPLLASGELPTAGGARAAVTVTVPLARLERPCDAPTDAQLLLQEIEDAGVHGRRSHELFSGGSATVGVSNGPGSALVSAEAAQRLTCDCEVHRIVIDPAGVPLDVGRTMRTFPPHMRKALELRDGGCVFPGCSRPPGWAEAHHIVHWAQGGSTSLDNAALLCSRHHHGVHSDKHEITMGADGRPVVTLNRRRL